MNWQIATQGIITASMGAFGEEVKYLPMNGLARDVRAIFEAVYAEVDPQSGVSIGTVAPAIDLRLADLACTPSPGDRVCIRNEMYRVMSYQPDGQGAAKLLLHKI